MENRNKNVYIEFLRFIAASVIFGYHANYIFHSGWIFVEFFFLLSGYFAYAKIESRKKEVEPFKDFPVMYTSKKMLRILPYTILSMVLFIVLELRDKLWFEPFVVVGKFVLYVLENGTLLNATGIIGNDINLGNQWIVGSMLMPILWYILALFVALPIMMYIVFYLEKYLGIWLYTFLPLLLYGILIQATGTIDGFHYEMGIYPALCIRALAGLLLGALVFRLKEYFKMSIKNGIIAGIVEILLMVVVLLIAMMENARFELVVILCFVFSLAITFSGKTVTSYIKGRIFILLGTISLPIYCVHTVILDVCKCNRFVIYGITIVLSLGMVFIVKGISYGKNIYKEKHKTR